MSMKRCEKCGREKVKFQDDENIYGCPVHDDPERERRRCRGCWEVDWCLLHHVSYIPEATVPMCRDCHADLHKDGPFLSHLEPDLSRAEAEELRDKPLKIGVDVV